MTGRWVYINMPYFANESVLTIFCLECPPSLIVYTAAKKSTRDHVYDCEIVTKSEIVPILRIFPPKTILMIRVGLKNLG